MRSTAQHGCASGVPPPVRALLAPAGSMREFLAAMCLVCVCGSPHHPQRWSSATGSIRDTLRSRKKLSSYADSAWQQTRSKHGSTPGPEAEADVGFPESSRAGGGSWDVHLVRSQWAMATGLFRRSLTCVPWLPGSIGAPSSHRCRGSPRRSGGSSRVAQHIRCKGSS